MTQPTPDIRLAERLRGLPPDALRDILALWDRARLYGSGEITVTIRVADGRETVSVAREYERRIAGGA